MLQQTFEGSCVVGPVENLIAYQWSGLKVGKVVERDIDECL